LINGRIENYCVVFLVLKFQADAGFEADVPQIVECLANAQALARVVYKKKITLSKVAARNTRGPIFFKFVRVDYDKYQGRLKLSEGEFPGHSVRSNREDAYEKLEYREYAESIVGSVKEESYSAGKKTNQLIIVNDNFNAVEL